MLGEKLVTDTVFSVKRVERKNPLKELCLHRGELPIRGNDGVERVILLFCSPSLVFCKLQNAHDLLFFVFLLSPVSFPGSFVSFFHLP